MGLEKVVVIMMRAGLVLAYYRYFIVLVNK